VTRVLGKIGHVASQWLLCKSLDKQKTRNWYKGWENSFHPSGIPGRVLQLVIIPVRIMWLGVLVLNNESLAQQHKP